MCGTAEFLAPEVVNYDFVSAPTDMWAVGVITYILLSGYSPFLGDNELETFNNITSCSYDFDVEEFENISEEAKSFICKLLLKNPLERLTVEQAGWLSESDLSSYLSLCFRRYLTPGSGSPTPWTPWRRPSSRRRT